MKNPFPRLAFALTMAMSGIAFSASASAGEYPALLPGLWELQRSIGSQKTTTRKCSDPVADVKRQNAMLEKAGCRFSPATRAGNLYSFEADCAIHTPGGATTHAVSRTVIVAESNSSYRLHVKTSRNGHPSEETLTARRVGNC